MENKSPFGTVCGLKLSGAATSSSSLTANKVIQLSVKIVSDAGLNVSAIQPSANGCNNTYEWGGVGNVCYSDVGARIDVSIAYMHSLDTETLDVSITMTFKPHGWIKFRETCIQLDRVTEVSLGIPVDVIDEKLSATMAIPRPQLRSVESVYGKRLTDKRLRDQYGRSVVPSSSSAAAAGGRMIPNAHDKRIAELEGRDAMLVMMERRQKMAKLSNEGEDVDEVIYNTLAVQRSLEMAKEAQRCEQVTATWKSHVTAFVVCLVGGGDARRTRQLIGRWHQRAPLDESTPTRIMSVFMDLLLHSRPSLALTDTHLYLFADQTGGGYPEPLSISLTALTTAEQLFCTKLYIHRDALFSSITLGAYGNKRYRLSGFRLDASVVAKCVCPRFVLQQMAIDCAHYGIQRKRPEVLLTFIAAVGELCVKYPKNKMLLRLKIALEQPSIERSLEEIGLFVKIGHSAVSPEYETNVIEIMDTNGGGKRPRTISMRTPFRLSGFE